MTKKLTPFRDTRVCACGDHGFTGLTRGHVAICDPEDVEALSGRLWCLEGAWPRRYAMNGATAERYAHRLIGKPESGQHVDHINGDTLDNRRSNLRACTPKQNVTNRKPRRGGSGGGFKGVFKDRGAYRAKICVDYKTTRLGTFSTAELAARAYDEAAVRLHGEFACTNAMLGLLDASRPPGRGRK